MGTAQQNKVLGMIREQYSDLPPTLQLAAKYVIDHPADFGIDPIRSTAEKIGVSTYSLVRLARELGYPGFEEFRDPFRRALRASSKPIINSNWLDELSFEGETGTALANSAENAMSILKHSLRQMTPEKANAFITRLTQARTVYVTATRASYSLAYYFQHVVRLVLPNVQLIPRDMANPIDDLNFASDQDVLLAITVKPYSQITVNACKFAREKGLGLLIITDSQLPLADLKPDAVLTAEMDSPHGFACYLGVMSILESLIHLLVKEGGQQAQDNIKSYQELKARMDGSSPF
ncbi:RpiR family transcriptional regulator [Amylibacter ulvae]|uniref:RpiR family transcriptional regulator n=1 Tax=Paramylibacter ulvae TaxID=1651968 RepID=A0ABQ3D4G3_9RHOB|nr:MurR/RpiR family transcriptional regulator [Amylibacter ulvae]GHA58383.1 RpiR family transcriptional regulator [Amylibacter ulvae]